MPPPSTSGEHRSFPARRVLVVDDDDDSARVLALLLEADGHDVRTALDGDRALATARDFDPELVFLDLRLGATDGTEVARALRREESGPGRLLLALSGRTEPEVVESCRRAGFDGHVAKPIEDFDAIRRVVRTLDVRALGNGSR